MAFAPRHGKVMDGYKSLLDEHESLRQLLKEESEQVETAAAEAFLDKVRGAGADESLAYRREALRRLAGFWADFLQERTGIRPDSAIAEPADSAIPISSPTTLPPGTTAVNRSERNPSLYPVGIYAFLFLLAVGLIAVSIWWVRDSFPGFGETEALVTPEATSAPTTGPVVTDIPAATAVSVIEITVVATNTPAAATVVQAYTVQSGDSLIGIATRFGVDVELLRAANNMSDDLLQVGQTIWIPVNPAVVTPLPLVTATPAVSAAVISPTAVLPEPAPLATIAVSPAPVAEMVIRAAAGQGMVTLRALPAADGEPVAALLPGTLGTAVGRLADSSWYLVELPDSRLRGWLPAAEIGLIYPATPEMLPTITLP